MSCNTCQVKFSFFTKDIGCPGCNFSCCSKCLKYKCDIPDVGKRKVCGCCYNKLNKMNKSSPDDVTMDGAVMPNVNEEPLAPIDITMKLDSLENPVKPPIVIYKRTNHWDKLKMGLEPADQQIVDRLRKLKNEKRDQLKMGLEPADQQIVDGLRKLKDEEWKITLPTVEEIKQRLALLKDQNPDAAGSNVIDIHQDTRTDQEKADDLIEEYLAEMELPSTSNLYKDIECFDQDTREEINPSDDNTTLVSKISAMEIETPPNIEDDDENENEDEDENEDENECVMCSRTANKFDLYRCPGCTGDLYCLSCFESSHDESEMMDKHKAIRFVKENEKDKLSSAKMSLIRKLLTSDGQKNNH